MNRRLQTSIPFLAFGLVALLAAIAGCGSSSAEPQVVVYTALDSEYSQPIFGEFQRLSGIEPLPKFDTESTKTVGLAQAILAEADRPRCDVFWNNEILHTVRLERRGLLEVYRSPAAKDFPAGSGSPGGYWQGFAARARILLVNDKIMQADRAAGAAQPNSVDDLADPRWRGRIGMAKPLFGTTATHAACLFATRGSEKAREFFLALKKNEIQVLSGNKQVADAVANGSLAFGLTDTDDAMEEIDGGAGVSIVFPDQAAGQPGTLFIPNTLAILRGCPHPEAARKLVDYLLSPVIEETLAKGPSAQIPLNPRATAAPRIASLPLNARRMNVDFYAAAKSWDEAAAFLRETFTQ